jgi:hypothetical protein
MIAINDALRQAEQAAAVAKQAAAIKTSGAAANDHASFLTGRNLAGLGVVHGAVWGDCWKAMMISWTAGDPCQECPARCVPPNVSCKMIHLLPLPVLLIGVQVTNCLDERCNDELEAAWPCMRKRQMPELVPQLMQSSAEMNVQNMTVLLMIFIFFRVTD